MRTRFIGFVLALSACGGDVARPGAPPSNRDHEAPSPALQHLGTFVVASFGKTCPMIHHITIMIDGVERVAIDANCKPVPVPGPNGVVVIDTSSPTFDGLPVELAPGPHVISTHDAATNLSNQIKINAPIFDSAPEGEPKRLADIVVIVAGDEQIGVTVGTRSRMVLL